MKKHKLTWWILKKLGVNIHDAYEVHIHIFVEPPVIFEVKSFVRDKNDLLVLSKDKTEIQKEIKRYWLKGFRLKKFKG